MTSAAAPASAPARRGPEPATFAPPSSRRAVMERLAIGTFVVVPLLAVAAAVPVAWGWGLGWVDVALFAVFYTVTCLGITVGYHRYFTHGSFKANRPLRVALAVAGSMAVQGHVLTWVADHRRHHQFSDKEGDPHSPWLYGDSVGALAKGMLHAHVGWLFDRERTNKDRFIPDLLADRDLQRVNRAFPLLVLATLLLPALLGGLLTWSWAGALSAFFWAGLVRVALLHHATWSINSICHTVGDTPFAARDKSGNVWWLAIASMGESWHNLHHADPTCARHGVLKGQIDPSARVIRWFEQLGWATDVRWPKPERLAAKRRAEEPATPVAA